MRWGIILCIASLFHYYHEIVLLLVISECYNNSNVRHVRSSFIASDDDDIDFAMVCQIYKSTNGLLGKMPQQTCPYTGEMYTEHLLNGHPCIIREIFLMDAPKFRSFGAELKRRDFIAIPVFPLSFTIFRTKVSWLDVVVCISFPSFDSL
ncbi:unnamed protein product [Camellia sinensis]